MVKYTIVTYCFWEHDHSKAAMAQSTGRKRKVGQLPGTKSWAPCYPWVVRVSAWPPPKFHQWLTLHCGFSIFKFAWTIPKYLLRNEPEGLCPWSTMAPSALLHSWAWWAVSSLPIWRKICRSTMHQKETTLSGSTDCRIISKKLANLCQSLQENCVSWNSTYIRSSCKRKSSLRSMLYYLLRESPWALDWKCPTACFNFFTMRLRWWIR